jgi:tetratricopeptide (TPR) repeat protein
MRSRRRVLSLFLLTSCALLTAQEQHSHGVQEDLGEVSFPTTCDSSVQAEFNRSVALLHSFAYPEAEKAFRNVAKRDPGCAMAHWGVAMTHFHQLWQPRIAATEFPTARDEIQRGLAIGTNSQRELKYIKAAEVLLQGDASTPYETRGPPYEQAMKDLASGYPTDTEAQVFYALALLSNAPPSDKTHSKQKQAVAILEPIFAKSPRHPGVAHYLIHAYDNAEMASLGLPAARSYSKIAPSAPHALHMPSHIFTRLGLWEDSIASNIAARDAAHSAGDSGEELHAMDYLVYAYLQLGRDEEAAQVVQKLKSMPRMNMNDFKVAYAATAMPIRCLVERQRWTEAAAVPVPGGLPAEVEAIVVWSNGLGSGKTGAVDKSAKSLQRLQQIEDRLRTSGSTYWATQVEAMRKEVAGWQARAEHHEDLASQMMREAADLEDSVEKLPVTPGPIVPAREQLGYLLLEQGHPELAMQEFQAALKEAPGRRNAVQGMQRAASEMNSK